MPALFERKGTAPLASNCGAHDEAGYRINLLWFIGGARVQFERRLPDLNGEGSLEIIRAEFRSHEKPSDSIATRRRLPV
jgi:hypothetical protein